MSEGKVIILLNSCGVGERRQTFKAAWRLVFVISFSLFLIPGPEIYDLISASNFSFFFPNGVNLSTPHKQTEPPLFPPPELFVRLFLSVLLCFVPFYFFQLCFFWFFPCGLLSNLNVTHPALFPSYVCKSCSWAFIRCFTWIMFLAVHYGQNANVLRQKANRATPTLYNLSILPTCPQTYGRSCFPTAAACVSGSDLFDWLLCVPSLASC